jgi:hypothetical protein
MYTNEEKLMRAVAQVRLRAFVGAALLGLGAMACSPERVVGDAKLPPDIPDPTAVETPAGAVSAYYGALAHFHSAFGGEGGSFVSASGILADELQVEQIGVPVGVFGTNMRLDSRTMPEVLNPGFNERGDAYGSVYAALQKVRGQVAMARGLLTHYAPDSLQALSGHLYALEGYAEIFLADLYCSGIPLSTVDFDGDYTLRAGSTTSEVYRHAVALFDSAMTLAADSARIVDVARVGKARALLALAEYDQAAQAAAEVPDDFRYLVSYVNRPGSRNFAYFSPGAARPDPVADREGENGLDYISSHDPRTAATPIATTTYDGRPVYFPDKYATTGDSPILLASGTEARLIEAEVALQQNDGRWLAMLNALRTDGTYDTQPDAQDSARVDTLWHAGSGGTAGLAPLADPGTPAARLDLVFRERAFWLFLTGHRQGDMRRLIRNYGIEPERVYPTGPYPGGAGHYGTDVTAPIMGESSNPYFRGCSSRSA